jgi:hypothetical protein
MDGYAVSGRSQCIADLINVPSTCAGPPKAANKGRLNIDFCWRVTPRHLKPVSAPDLGDCLQVSSSHPDLVSIYLSLSLSFCSDILPSLCVSVLAIGKDVDAPWDGNDDGDVISRN